MVAIMTRKTEELLNLLKEKKLTLGSAESFTAGLFASEFCSVSGASAVFKGAIVCYDRKIKESVLGLSPELIDKYDVVSEEVAYALAESAQKTLDVDVAVSFTGNAGPTAEPGKARVGETYMGIAIKGQITTYKMIFDGERNQIREKAVEFMIEKLIESIK